MARPDRQMAPPARVWLKRSSGLSRTMLVVVGIAASGLRMVRLKPLERFSHALAGGAICLSGLAIQFLGL